MKGDFSLNKDDVIYILVGQKGLDSTTEIILFWKNQ